MLLSLAFAMAAFAGPLDGDWRQDCEAGYSREEVFSGDLAVYTERNFWDSACTRASVETISRGEIALGEETAAPAGARAIDFIFSAVALRPLDDRTVAAWNERGVCGFRDWSAGSEKEVTGRECDFFGLGSVVRVPAKGTRKYGVVKAQGGDLYFGRLTPERDGSSSITRPLMLDPSPYRGYFTSK